MTANRKGVRRSVSSNPKHHQDCLFHRPPYQLSCYRQRNRPEITAVKKDVQRLDIIQEHQVRVSSTEGQKGEETGNIIWQFGK